jgi:hypothetical protein
VLSLFETYMHGRPRVSAPRTFDGYAHGDTTRPLGAEKNGLARIESTVGGRFQRLCPDVADAKPEQARLAIDTAMAALQSHLRETGHGGYAFITTAAPDGSSHTWAAINQNGTILFLDPQTGKLAEGTPLYAHSGISGLHSVTSVDALVVDGRGQIAPLPSGEAGYESSQNTLEPTGSEVGAGGVIDPAIRAAIAGARREEERLLTTLRPALRAALDASIVEAERTAEQVFGHLHEVVESYAGPHAANRPRIVGAEHRVKKPASLARAVRAKLAFDEADAVEVFAAIKDRVRFSVEVHEETYGSTVKSLLDGLRDRGYRTGGIVNFWRGDGRHNGLNVTLVNDDGFLVELQFPTPLSWSVGKGTHGLYEVTRLSKAEPTARVRAFLHILRINKLNDMASHQPSELEPSTWAAPIDTTFAEWINAEPEVWSEYRMALDEDGVLFADVLDEFGLTRDDLLGAHRSKDGDDQLSIQLSSRPQVGRVGDDHQPDRLPGRAEEAAPGRAVGRPREGVDFGTVAGGPDAVRQREPGQGPGDRPSHGGAGGDGSAPVGTPDGGRPDGTHRPGRSDGLGLRPPANVAGPADDDPDLSRQTAERLLSTLAREPQATVAEVDGRDAGLTIDAAVRALRRAVATLRRRHAELPDEVRMTVLTGDGSAVTWQASTGVISVSV